MATTKVKQDYIAKKDVINKMVEICDNCFVNSCERGDGQECPLIVLQNMIEE